MVAVSRRAAAEELVRHAKKGRAAIATIQVKQDDHLMNRVYNLYIYVLRLPLPAFFLCMLSTPLLLSAFFTCLYLLDANGLHVIHDDDWDSRTFFDWMDHAAGEFLFKIFMFSLSLSTTFNGTRVEARSPYSLLIANINTLTAQLIFVFLSGAVFHRLSQPAQPVKWSSVALITEDGTAEAFADRMLRTPRGAKCRSFLVRMNLTGSHCMELVDAKFSLVLRRRDRTPGTVSEFLNTFDLPLVRPEEAYLKYGFLLRHVIDEKSPLHEQSDYQSLLDADASFTVAVSATERSSMQPIFSERLYTVYDKEVLWDREFEDQWIGNEAGSKILDHRKLSKLKKKAS